MGIVDVVISWSKRKRGKGYKIMCIVAGATVYGILIPLTIAYASLMLDEMLGLKLGLEPYNIVLAVPLIVFGLFFISWAAWAQWHIGKGTPAPMAPTQKLVVSGPYAYCRNPMMFGSLLYYLGLIILVNSATGIIIVAIIEALYALYVKFIEEKELELRFGKEYVEYKKRTPFLIPWPRRRQ